MSYESVVLHGRDHEAVTVVLPVPRLRTIYTQQVYIYIYIYIGSGKRGYSALPPFYSSYTASIEDYQRSINVPRTIFNCFQLGHELEQASMVLLDPIFVSPIWKIFAEIKLIGIGSCGSSLFNTIGAEEREKIRTK